VCIADAILERDSVCAKRVAQQRAFCRVEVEFELLCVQLDLSQTPLLRAQLPRVDVREPALVVFRLHRGRDTVKCFVVRGGGANGGQHVRNSVAAAIHSPSHFFLSGGGE
jgi:hypothetical protein